MSSGGLVMDKPSSTITFLPIKTEIDLGSSMQINQTSVCVPCAKQQIFVLKVENEKIEQELREKWKQTASSGSTDK